MKNQPIPAKKTAPPVKKAAVPAKKTTSIDPKSERRYFQLLADTGNLSIEKKVWFISRIFYVNSGYYPNFKRPKSFNEKINWLRLNYCNPAEVAVDDKAGVKNYVKEVLGEEYVIPTLGIYDDVNDIDFDKLPEKFVIKTTVNSTGRGITVVKDKSKLDQDYLKYTYVDYMQEWQTASKPFLFPTNPKIKPRVIIEEYCPLLDEEDCDYEFFCFHGEPKFFYIANSFAKNTTQESQVITFYDLEGNQLPLTYAKHHRSSVQKLEKSANFDRMIEFAKKLSAPFPFVRVDFYDLHDKLYVGEMTFKSGGGFSKFEPVDWDYRFGEMLDLKKVPKEFIHLQEGFPAETCAGEEN